MNLTEVPGKIEKVFTFDLAKLPVGTVFLMGSGFPSPYIPVVLLGLVSRSDPEGGQNINYGHLLPVVVEKHQWVVDLKAEGPFVVNGLGFVPVLSETRDTWYWVVKDLPWYLAQIANLTQPEEHYLTK